MVAGSIPAGVTPKECSDFIWAFFLETSWITKHTREPYYFYSKLADLKINIISQATKDAKLRAEMITKSSKSILGRLLTAKIGVFQIIAKNYSTENYSWGGRQA